MAKSANSKVIFLPGANQTMLGSAAFNAALEHPTGAEDAEREQQEPLWRLFRWGQWFPSSPECSGSREHLSCS